MVVGAKMSGKAKPRIVFFWNNFGPMHADRVDAVARRLGDRAGCLGLELFASDETYDWVSETRPSFEKITLFRETGAGMIRRLGALLGAVRRVGAKDWFLCHYERPEVLILAVALRLTGHRVFTMGCSKFDDFPRGSLREALKSVFLWPYHGAIGSPERSQAYFRFLGLRRRPVVGTYNTLSIDRIRQLSGGEIAPDGVPFGERDFVVVARLVEKKNLPMALEAFARFAGASPNGRRLHLCGSGPLEADLRARATELGLADRVVFHGFQQTAEVAQLLARGVALILPSTEEQFGNVVIEAQAMGLPVLVSDVAGARDALVRNWQNGFVFEPDNPEGLAEFMGLIDRDETLWRRLCAGATATAPRGDVERFSEGVEELIGAAER